MPIYLYEHPKTHKVREVIQGCNDEHVFVDDKGVKWDRVWTIPQAGFDTKQDPFSQNAFYEKTGKTKGETMKHLWARSAELSEKRAEKNGGIDPVKEQYLKDYSKARKGKPHPTANKDKVYEI